MDDREHTAGQTFTNVDDTVLVRMISTASTRIVFVSPGLRQPVAAALSDAMRRLPGQVTIVLDVDAEVCRLGYGDQQGLDFMKTATDTAGVALLHQPGIRIGLLLADNDTVIYSPVPLLIEAGSQQPDKPNAIVLNEGVPRSIESACGVGQGAEKTRQVGLTTATSEGLEAVKQDLKSRPPKEFDIARIERVFNSELQFVEMEISNYRLASKKVSLDVELLGMSDDYLRERVENTFKPFDDAEFLNISIPKVDENGNQIKNATEIFGPDVIDRERRRIKQTFLFDLPKFGVVLRRANKEAFEQALHVLRIKLTLYEDAVKEQIADQLNLAKQKLKRPLLDLVTKNTPPTWRKYAEANTIPTDVANRLIDETLSNAFAKIAPGLHAEVQCMYKEATYDTIHDARFRQALEKHFGRERVQKLFSEYDAAPEIPKVSHHRP